MIIWASLSWRFLKLEEIGKYYEKEASVLGYTNDRSWQDCLNRLIVRGLVVCGSGETDYDALYDLLSPLFIIPLTGNVAARVFTYAKEYCGVTRFGIEALLMRSKGMGVTDIARLYQVKPSHVGARISRAKKQQKNNEQFIKDIA